MTTLHIYTDGAHSSKNNAGGWAYMVIADNKQLHKVYGGEADTTNNRMEMTAVAKALEYVWEQVNDQPTTTINLYIDSAYVHNAFTQGWIDTWLKNGWKTTAKTLVKNRDLWVQMLKLKRLIEAQDHKIIFNKVEGHSTNKYNNEVDKLAVQGRKEVK